MTALLVLDKNAIASTSTGDNYFPLMDRMGNIFGYRSSDSGSAAVLSAVYEYDAFGREMKSLGSASDKMPFRFSSKFTDTESGLVYYGYRYYDPVAGRWINRDPIGERGGENLQAFVMNGGTNYFDPDGLVALSIPGGIMTTLPEEVPPKIPDPHRNPPPLLEPEWTPDVPFGQQKIINNLKEMVDRFLQQMMSEGKCCIQELQWSGHASGQHILLRNRDRAISPPGANDRNSNPEAYTELNSVNADRAADYVVTRLSAAGRPFCKPCVIWMTACNSATLASKPFVGASTNTQLVGSIIAKATGCEIRFPRGFCSPNLLPENSNVHRLNPETGAGSRVYPNSVDYVGGSGDYASAWDRYDHYGLIR